MNNREKRKRIAEDTLEILDKGYFENTKGEQVPIQALLEQSINLTKLYTPQASDELLQNQNLETLNETTTIKVTNQTTLDAVRTLIDEGHEEVVCLNFASAKNPGGGFLGGSQAQEESIARSTGLYKSQLNAFTYYEVNRATKSCVYTDHMIYSPFVPIIKKEDGTNMDKLTYCAVITAPAVNKGVVKHREPKKLDELEAIMKRRISKVLSIALAHHHKTIVLGAWGCGVFQNDPVDIAKYFKEVIDSTYTNKFKKIVFAIYSSNERFITPFINEFGK